MTVGTRHPYIQTPLHTRGCTLGRYENWPHGHPRRNNKQTRCSGNLVLA